MSPPTKAACKSLGGEGESFHLEDLELDFGSTSMNNELTFCLSPTAFNAAES